MSDVNQMKLFAVTAAIASVLCFIGMWIHKHEADLYAQRGYAAMASIEVIRTSQDSLRMAIVTRERAAAQVDSLAREIKLLRNQVK